MQDIVLRLILASYQKDYLQFMGIDRMPNYQLLTKEVSQELADARGFEAPADSHYSIKNKVHTLTVGTNVRLTKYVMFHEFTHIIDAEAYTNDNPFRYAGLSGFTEYHASQVELMQLLGAESITQPISFSMNTIIDAFSKKSVFQYVEEKRLHAVELFSRGDFPADLETFKSAVGVLYNYLGLRSICEMYAVDYKEIIDNAAFLKYIPTANFASINRLMHGWMDRTKIEVSIVFYNNTFLPIIQEYKLC